MDILIIQKEAFEEMAARFSRFTERVDAILAKQGGKSLNGWMDNQEVCRLLNISPRTLQDYRNTGMIGLLPVGRKDSVQRIGHRADACRQLPGSVQICRHIMPVVP